MRYSLLLSLLLLAGCVSERVVLLPSADGRPGAVVIRDGSQELLLDRPYAGSVRRSGANTPVQSSAELVNERYAATLAAMPPRPLNYILYFEEGSDRLTPASEAVLVQLKAEIAGRTASEAMVVGHSDRVGTAAANESLSLKRAESVRRLLIEAGIPAEKLEAVGRGEREPLVPTEDEVAEPRNRRVEIDLR